MAYNRDFVVKNGLVVLGSGSAQSTSTTTGALVTPGGVGVGGNLHVAGDVVSHGIVLTNFNTSTLVAHAVLADLATTATSAATAYALANTSTTFVGLASNISAYTINQNLGTGNSPTFANLNINGTITATQLTIQLTTITTTLVQTDDVIQTLNTTQSTGTSSGALIIAGGAGVAGNLYAGAVYDNGARVWTTATLTNNNQLTNGAGYLTSATIGGGGVGSITAGTDTAVSGSTGAITIWGTSTLQSVTNRGSTTTNSITINNALASTSTAQDNALYVTGGLGVGDSLYVGGALFAQATSFVAGAEIITTATFAEALGTSLATVTFTATYITQTPGSVLVPNVGTTTTYGTYNFGSLTDITSYGDYNTATNTGFYSVNDATGAPAFVTYIGFENVTQFNRAVFNINYTASSGHTVNIDLYNYDDDAWDTFAVYSGSGNWQQFALGLIDHQPYVSAANSVTSRIYHVSSGNTSHRTWIDYVALEQSTTGGQGPRGATGATGATGAQGVNTGTTSTFIISNTTNSLGTNSGALQVAGGAGIGGNLYVGGSITTMSPIIYDQVATQVGVGSVVLDSFDMTKYRAAKYFVSVSNTSTNKYQASEILLIQDGVSASIEQTSVFSNGDNIIAFSTLIIGSIVYLRGSGTDADNTVKVQPTYITV